MHYCFDLDNTLCDTDGTDYENSTPIASRISKVNNLFDSGHEITIFTARGSLLGKSFEALTEKQLQDWGLKYSSLRFGKPPADIFIDDRGCSDIDFFEN